MMKEINIDNMKVPKAYINVLKYHNIIEGEELISTLDKYKIMSREIIVKCLCIIGYNNITLLDDKEIDIIYKNNKVVVNDKYGLVIVETSTNSKVFYNKLKAIDEIECMCDLKLNNPQFIGVLPTNLNELKGTKDKDLDDIILFRRFIAECVKEGGSDCRFEVITVDKESRVKISFRVDNTLVEYKEIFLEPKDLTNMLTTVVKELANVSISDFNTFPVDGNIDNILCDNKLEGRFGSCKTEGGLLFNIRIQQTQTLDKTVYDLGFDKLTENVLSYAQNKENGITLITGPQNTGKSTTLWAMANHFAKQPLACIEYSAPIEVKLPMPQVDYGSNISLLNTYLKVVVKQDMDIVFLNEIPNKNIASALRTLATSSMHVLTTFHIDRIWHLFRKLYEFYGDNFKSMLSQLNVVVNQKMYVRQCPYCTYDIMVSELENPIRNFLHKANIHTVKINKGCIKCNNGDLIGAKKVLAEHLVFDDELVQDLLRFENDIDMERYTKELFLKNENFVKSKNALEFKLLECIKNGELSYKSLYTIM